MVVPPCQWACRSTKNEIMFCILPTFFLTTNHNQPSANHSFLLSFMTGLTGQLLRPVNATPNPVRKNMKHDQYSF